MLDLVVVGGGPAGLTGAVYAMRQRLSVLLISPQLGGRTESRTAFAHAGEGAVIRGEELVRRFKNEISYLEIARRKERVLRVRRQDAAGRTGRFLVETSGGETLETRAVLVATGSRFEPPQVEGARRYLLKGIGYSATSYAHLFLDRRAVVIGSGMRAVRSALRLAYSASRVYLLPEEGKDPGPALSTPEGRALAAIEGVKLLADCRVAGFAGDGFAAEVLVGRPDGSTESIPADGFFLEAEASPNSDIVAELVERDPAGYIKVDSRNRTSREGIFAAGDVTDVHHEQVVVAAGEGAKASLSAQEYLFAGREDT